MKVLRRSASGAWIHSPARHSGEHIKWKIEVVGGVPQRVYRIPLRSDPAAGLTGLSPDEMIDRIIIGPTQYPFATFDAFVSALDDAGVKEPAKSDFRLANTRPDVMSKAGWQRRFHNPITVGGRTLATLHDAATYITELPDKVSRQPHWQTAVRELMMAAERGGILMLAEIAMRRAIHHSAPEKPERRKRAKAHRIIR
jgi:hypothetical protein